MTKQNTFDVAIAGGGLAGLALAIQFSRAGIPVILFEKETYPFHRVCGEYISMESWDFLRSLGLPLNEMGLPRITKLKVTAPDGNYLEEDLDLGGFGISRFTLDHMLMKIAVGSGAVICEGIKVNDIKFENEQFSITTSSGTYHSTLCFGSFGKKSNIDNKLRRSFTHQKPNKLNNLVGIKYHVKYDHDPSQISLHNFENGYCGMSRVEGDRSCLCYLTSANNLKMSGNSIMEMERTILSKNPDLKKIFSEAEYLFTEPVTISQVSLEKKSAVVDHIIMTGDAAGMIAPLCGNGMSIALRSAKIGFELSQEFFASQLSRQDLESRYKNFWAKEFGIRMRTGRFLQKRFGKPGITNLFISLLRSIPWLRKKLIRLSHGTPF